MGSLSGMYMIITGWAAYIGKDAGTESMSQYAAAARSENVEGLPRLYLDCPQLDILVHENLAYVQRFMASNVPTEFHLFTGLPYGFIGLAPTSTAARRYSAWPL